MNPNTPDDLRQQVNAVIEALDKLPNVTLGLSSVVKWLEDAAKEQKDAAEKLLAAATAFAAIGQPQAPSAIKQPGPGQPANSISRARDGRLVSRVGLTRAANSFRVARQVFQTGRRFRIGAQRIGNRLGRTLQRQSKALGKTAKAFGRVRVRRNAAALQRTAIKLKSGAGRLAAGGGARVLGVAGQAAAGLGGVATAATGLAAAGAAAVTLGAALYGGARAVEAHGRSLLKSQEHLKQMSGTIAMAFGRMEIADVYRNLGSARRTGETTAYLAENATQLSNTLQPFKDLGTNLSNVITGAGQSVLEEALRPLLPLIEELNLAAKELMHWIMTMRNAGNNQLAVEKIMKFMEALTSLANPGGGFGVGIGAIRGGLQAMDF